MKFYNLLLVACAALVCTSGCKPKPLAIHIDQKPADMSIASVAYDAHTVFVSAGYTVSSFANLLDTVQGSTSANKEMMVDSGVVIIATPNRPADTLTRVSPGLYSKRNATLQSGADYTLTVIDLRRNKTATAVTRYFATSQVDTLQPILVRRPTDTMVKVHLALSNVSNDDYFFIHYTPRTSTSKPLTPYAMNVSMLQSFAPKRIELINGSEAKGGRIVKDIILDLKGNDTAYIQCSRIDAQYAKYLEAYKRTGDLINQFTGEPIHLPTNIHTGFGFFSLYLPQRYLFVLNDY